MFEAARVEIPRDGLPANITIEHLALTTWQLNIAAPTDDELDAIFVTV